MFQQALPVWAQGQEQEMNCFLRFSADVPGEGMIRIAANSIYRIFIGGEFLCTGPARAPLGYSRVDVIPYHTADASLCELHIEVGAYGCNSFEYLDEPGFLQCEVESGGEIIAATGRFGWRAFSIPEKLQKVQRYSFQRTFCEEYDFTQKAYAHEITLCCRPARKLLPRRVPDFDCSVREIDVVLHHGAAYRETNEEVPQFPYVDQIGDTIKGFPKQQLESFLLRDIGINSTGMIGLRIAVQEETNLYLVFDEILTNRDVDFIRTGATNAVRFRLPAGSHTLQTFEPYTFRYLKLISIGGSCEIQEVWLRQMVSGSKILPKHMQDPVLNKIYQAGMETFRQNATDIFMDCPSRERAGWLCDSFFTARAEYALTGKSVVERNFLENYLLPKEFSCLPKGIVPMCYPADHLDGLFIPNWAMWLLLELKEYWERSGDWEMIQQFKERVYGIIRYLDSFLNSDGLLEDLESWVFLEWSKANELVQGVNYPTNMLYALALDSAGKLYDDYVLCNRGKSMLRVICQQSFDGEFFHDHAVRKDGVLTVEKDCTETCQYYAFFCGAARPQYKAFHTLWSTLILAFGPKRKISNKYPEIAPSNAFIGNYLRLELLFRARMYEQLKEEIKEYFSGMADITGTLWEHDAPTASCCHGFASHVVYWLNKITE